MKLEFIDCNCQIGRNVIAKPYNVLYSPEDLKTALKSLNIIKAFCFNSAARDTASSDGNKLLLDAVKNDDFFIPSYTVIPNSSFDSLTGKELEDELLANDIKLVRMFPAVHNFSMYMWSIGDLFELLNSHELTVIIPSEQVSPDNLFSILKNFKKVKIILTNIGYTCRNITQLMKLFDNLYVDTTYSVPDGLEFITEHFGSERIIFGTSAPFCSPGSYVGRVILSSVKECDKENIACKNIIRLTGMEV